MSDKAKEIDTQVSKEFGQSISDGLTKAIREGGSVLRSLPQTFDQIGIALKAASANIPWTEIWNKVKDAAISAFNTGRNMVSDLVDWFMQPLDPSSSEGDVTVKKIGQVLGYLVREAFAYAKGIWFDYIEPTIKDFAEGFADQAKGYFDPNSPMGSSNAKRLGGYVSEGLQLAFNFAKDLVVDYFKAWWTKIQDIWADPSKTLTEKFKETGENSAGAFIAAFALSKFTPFFGIIDAMVGAVGSLALGFVDVFATVSFVHEDFQAYG